MLISVVVLTVLFNSIQFLVFFPLVAAGCFAFPSRFRCYWLLVASTYFYMAWEATYIVLIGLSCLTGWCFTRYSRNRKLYGPAINGKVALAIVLAINLLVLFFFKYYNFARELISSTLGCNIDSLMPELHLLLPVGISFYTFQIIGYCVDLYRGRINADHNASTISLYTIFFPQLVAGPIERASCLMPQLRNPLPFHYEDAVEGLKLVTWGFFKKCVVADRIAPYVNVVYGQPSAYEGGACLLATYFFAFQIYADFSAYSDIARGTARILRIHLMVNFKSPYSAQSIREFWQRWHISLSTWFRDYLYIPLGGSRGSYKRTTANLFLVFVVSGLWHGANTTFLVWGAYHGALVVASVLRSKGRVETRRRGFFGAIRILLVFHAVLLGWVFFRADSLSTAFVLLHNVFTSTSILNPGISLISYPRSEILLAFVVIATMLVVDQLESTDKGLHKLNNASCMVRWTVYLMSILAIYYGGVFESSSFIYFQF